MWRIVITHYPLLFNLLQVIYTDVALDPYSSDGHDGIVREDGKLQNLPISSSGQRTHKEMQN